MKALIAAWLYPGKFRIEVSITIKPQETVLLVVQRKKVTRRDYRAPFS